MAAERTDDPPQAAASPFSATGKTAIVTGAGSGINLAFAKALLQRNCNVVFADLSLRPEAEELMAKHTAPDSQPRAVFVRTDVTKWPELSHMFEVAMEEFGGFDIVCPGAGVYEPHWSNFWHPPGSPESKDLAETGRYAMLDINLNHPIRSTQLALSYWLHPRLPANSKHSLPAKASPANPKRIIHISSVASELGVFRAPIYGASKWAITGFVRSMAQLDPMHGIKVTAVNPGIIRTPLWTEHPEKMTYIDKKKVAWVTPDEVAEAMLLTMESDKMAGGSVLEVGTKFREVKLHNDPGPDSSMEAGLFTSEDSQEADQVIWDWLDDEKIWGACSS